MASPVVGFGDGRYGQDEFSTVSFVVRQLMSGMATATLVRVEAVTNSGGKQTVDVFPLVNQTNGQGVGIPHQTIHGLPYMTMRGGSAAIEVTPVKGDIGLAVFCHSDISNVKKTKAQANPGSRRKFAWSDGVYFGGCLPASTAAVLLAIDASGAHLTGNMDVSGDFVANGKVQGGTVVADNGATGSFTAVGGIPVTVASGIITKIG